MRTQLLWAAACAAIGSQVFAHGPAIQTTVDSGKIITRQVLIDTYEPLTAPTSVYVAPVNWVADIDFGPSWRATPEANPANPFGPGIAYGVGGTFAGGSVLTLSFVDELLRWDGVDFVSAGATELAALRTSNPNATALTGNKAISGSADPSAEVNVAATYTASAHSQVTYVLLGDGMTTSAPIADGVYLAKLQLTSSDPLVSPSDPFYYVLNKGSATQLMSAIDSLGFAPSAVQYLAIPEPSALVLAALVRVAASRRTRS
jgi:hypothetical protein